MNIKKTVRKKIKKTVRERRSPSPDSNREMSSTMHIPVEAVLEDISIKSASHLDISCPGRDPVRIPLNNSEVVIGRENDCRICLPLTDVSRKHARVTCRGEEHLIEDLDSTNGTYVNGVRISRCILRNNDQIRIGGSRILFVQRKIRQKS